MGELRSIVSVELPSGDQISVVRRRFGGTPGKRVAIVAGVRGDTPEGVRVAHRVCALLEQLHASIRGTVDVVPCANPLAAHHGSRLWPGFDVDLNRMFPGKADGHPPEQVARALVDDLKGADQVVELRGAHPAFREAPQAHVRLRDERAAELAQHTNVVVVWRRKQGPSAPATLADQFPGTIALEGGMGNRLTPGVGEELAIGVVNLLAHLGLIEESALPFHWAGLHRPRTVQDAQVRRYRADAGGLFLPEVSPLDELVPGQRLGTIVDAVTGVLLQELVADAAGVVLALREQPVVFPGTMVARVVDP